MPQSFALRIESGEQAGQTHAITSKGLTVGRRPGNDLVIQDASVSGRHARFSIEGDGIVLVDLASTNGSFIDDKRVEQATLGAGAFLRLGKVELELIVVPDDAAPAATPMPRRAVEPLAMDTGADDIELELEEQPAAVPATAPPARKPAPVDELVLEEDDDLAVEDVDDAPAAETLDLSDFDDDQDGVHAVDQGALAKTKGSKAPALIGLALLLGAAGWYFAGMPGLPAGDDGGQATARPVASVPGNTLENASFEKGLAGWASDDEAGLLPFADAAWRASGEAGIGLGLEPGESARVFSKPVTISTQRNLAAGVYVAAQDGATARLGVEFSDSGGEHVSTIAWAAEARDFDDAITLATWVPAGYDRVRLVLDMAAATEAGSVGFDDAELVISGGAAPGAKTGDFELTPMGPGRLALGFIDRPLLIDMHATAPRAADGDLVATLSGGFVATVPAVQLRGGLATLGSGGFAPHGDEFTDAGVTSIVIGQGVSQLRLLLPSATEVSGRPVAGGFRIEASVESGNLRIETGFADERARAARLAQEARSAEERGHRGAALANWQALLDEVPFEAGLVATAEANRGRLITAGLEDLSALTDDFERARFFGLPDLFRECLTSVRALQTEYQGSEVATAAGELATQVAATMGELQSAGADEDRLGQTRAAVRAWAAEHGSSHLVELMDTAQKGGN